MLNFIKKHSFWVSLIAVFIVIIAIISGRAIKNKNQSASNDNQAAQVSLISVKDYQKNPAFVSANGTVQSLQQATIKSQVNAPVTAVNAAVGQHVSAGQIIAQLQNSDLRAAVAQASAAVQAAQANLAGLENGATNTQLKTAQDAVTTAQVNLENTKNQQNTLVANALSTLLNSGLTATAASTNFSTATATISGTYTGTAQGAYTITVGESGAGYTYNVTGLENAGDLVMTRGTAQPLGSKGLFITFSSSGDFIPNSTWTVNIPNTQASGYSAAYNAYQAALSTQQSAIAAAQAQLTTAQDALATTQAGASSTQIQAGQAAVAQAQANLQAAQAQLDKTIIRSPIDGTITQIPVKYGELASPGSVIATVVNNGGLQIVTHVSADDLPYIQNGASVTINNSQVGQGTNNTNSATGIVSNVATSVDPATQNAEVDIAVNNPAGSGLTVGESVTVQIASNASSTVSSGYLLPLQSVQISQDGSAYVYSISNGTAHQIKVIAGQVQGEYVEVDQGISSNNLQIASVAADLSDGEKVTVSQ